MVNRLLLLLIGNLLVTFISAQVTHVYAITSAKKGSIEWCEVKLININTGQSEADIHSTAEGVDIISTKSGKKIQSIDDATNRESGNDPNSFLILKRFHPDAASERDGKMTKPDSSLPFATTSAACAYDVHNDRLYFTPTAIPQLRYIDLKDPSQIYFVDDVSFGVVKSARDVYNQITRMVFTKKGKGYALTNNANHLIMFGGTKVEVKDMGGLKDDPLNASHSVHDSLCLGGDMVADIFDNLYLITGNHRVYRISLKTRIATYLGQIEGLPEGFTTNGAIAAEEDNIIVCSSVSTQGYFRFSLKDFKAVKVSTATEVYNASDLANDHLLFEKKEEQDHSKADIAQEQSEKSIDIYPNPVTAAAFKLLFQNQVKGVYQVQLLDIMGKLVTSKEMAIASSFQIEEFKLPGVLAKGNYMVRISDPANNLISNNKLVVQ